MASERIKALADDTVFGRNIANYHDFIGFCRWYPDLMFDLLKPQKGGINLHLDQRIFLRCDVRFFSLYGDFSRGYGKCIAGDSLIYTDNGIKEIGKIFNYQNDNIETHYLLNENVLNRYGKLEHAEIGLYNGKKECNKIVTEEGYFLTATKNHRVLSMCSNGKIEWITTDKLKIGDYVVINRNNNMWGDNNNIKDINKKMKSYYNSLSKQSKSHLYVRDLPEYIDEDLGLLYGYLIGDGCLTLDSRILFTNVGDSILDNYQRIMTEKFAVKKISKLRSNKYDYAIDDKYLRKYLEIVGLKQVRSYDKQVPVKIFECSKKVVSKFLRGLFDTDGTVDCKIVSLTSVSKKLVHQVQNLLLNFGIISSIYNKKTRSKFGHCYTLTISGNNIPLFNHCIGFGLERKQKLLDDLCRNNRNTNKDIIPYQNDFVKQIINDKINKGIPKTEYYNVSHGDNALTYCRLNRLLNHINESCKLYEHFKEINDNYYFFSKIKSISCVMVDTYDFHLPQTHSFVSNGFVSHNTYDEVLSAVAVALLYPGVSIAISAQTKENAASLIESKWNELTKHFPLLLNEIKEKPKFSQGVALIKFKNDSEIDAVANAQSTKGQRRRRLMIEESALLNNALFEDALEPVVETPRLTVGRLSIPDPSELNQQIHFFTTAGFKGSDEYTRIVGMVDDMENLNGKIVLGASWMLPCWYGRGSSKSQILQKKKNTSIVAFAQNYEQEWVGASDGALVNINKLLNCRVLSKAVSQAKGDDEYYMGVDVARSQKTSNNQSSVVVGRVLRNADKSKIIAVDIVNIIKIPNIMNFSAQAVKVKQIQKRYNAKMVICDGNGLGAGLIDCLLTESIDPITGESLGCWDTINDNNEPEIPNSPKIVYNLKAQSCQSEVITTFIDYVDGSKLRLLERRLENDFTESEWDDSDNKIRPFIETDAFIEETANLKMKHLSNGGLTIEKVVAKIDKDRVSALIYMLWYIDKFVRDLSVNSDYDFVPLYN